MKGPLVHLNGTGAGDLMAQQRALYEAVTAAVDVALAASPNARDYYPLGDGAFEAARAAHSTIVNTLVAIREGALLAYEAIQDQVDQRKAVRS